MSSTVDSENTRMRMISRLPHAISRVSIMWTRMLARIEKTTVLYRMVRRTNESSDWAAR